ncbi:MAG: NADH-quinone oxidoreductase subunit H [Ignavibacteria bacterium]|nr:NADH-quinone oxidoreductase subunit H [Ignavibacteria bacterium]
MITVIVVCVFGLVFLGIINRAKSVFGGRIGPRAVQSIWDVVRLFKKGSVISTTTSSIFQLAPSISFVCVIVATLLIPFGPYPAVMHFDYDVVLFAYVLALSRFVMIIAALDTGSPFQGMGANREGLYGMLVEPAFFVLFGSLSLFTGHTSFTDMFRELHLGGGVSYMMAGLAAYIVIQTAMIESSRLPVDDPKTHLELTMIHEVMILDHSGFDLGLITVTSGLKFAMYGVMLTNFFLPHNVWLPIALAIGIVVQFAFAITAGGLESFRARFKMTRNPQFIITLTSIAMLVYFSVLILMHKIGM